MYKSLSVALAIGAASVGAALAQQPPANPNAPSNPAVTSPSAPSATLPAPGANSFTENQAKARLENQGFTGVVGLMKDADGIWRGSATKGGRVMSVGVDYQGNIVEK